MRSKVYMNFALQIVKCGATEFNLLSNSTVPLTILSLFELYVFHVRTVKMLSMNTCV